MSYQIFLSPPHMSGKEIEYVKEAFQSNWISTVGPAITEFEKRMSAYIGVEHALAVSSGTAAMHLIFRYLGIGEGDSVFCSDFTFIGSCDPVFYEKVTPVFIDSEPDSWNMSPIALEKAFQWAVKENKMPKAVIIVDLYGESADYDRLLPICERYGVPVIEDAAEAVGSSYKGKRCGSFGAFAIQSFNGNKIITTSGGGMVLSNNGVALEKMRFWSTQAREPLPWYEHKEYGYNYRMSNICASIGLGQLEFIDSKVKRRKEIHRAYTEALSGISVCVKEHVDSGANGWLSVLMTTGGTINPIEIINSLAESGIESRPAWKPMHMQPIFKDAQYFTHYDDEFVDEHIFARSVCLPSGDSMTEEEVQFVISEVRKAIAGHSGCVDCVDFTISTAGGHCVVSTNQAGIAGTFQSAKAGKG